MSVGALPFYAGPGIRVIDMAELTDPHIAHEGIRVPDGLPGHAVYENAYLLARRPDIIFMPPPPDVAPGARPLTAAAVRHDPCAVAWLIQTGGEIGQYDGSCRPPPPEQWRYVLPARLDFERPERRAVLEAAYERARDLPGASTLEVYQRRGWQPRGVGRP